MSTQSSIKNLHQDKRGAIMLMGLCMSCFLIGSLWFIIGIGDAIVFRDTMQEATDHATFTAAVLHAKGMNFISACNLLILAMVGIHIIMGIVHDIMLAVCIISLGFVCQPWITARKVYMRYSKVFKPTAGALHYGEVAASYGFPLYASYKGWATGDDYGAFGAKKHDVSMIVMSPSLIPGGALVAPLNAALRAAGKPNLAANAADGKKGLPVMARTYGAVCDRIARIGVDPLIALAHVGGQHAIHMVKGWIAGAITFRYCNDMGTRIPDLGEALKQGTEAVTSANNRKSEQAEKTGETGVLDGIPDPKPGNGGNGYNGGNSKCLKDNSGVDPGLDQWWGCDGPLVPWTGTQNGGPWNDIWGMNITPEFTDAQEHNVAIAKRKYGATSTAPATTYMSQAEFYFDCTKTWRHEECNALDNAGYSVQWRARLKRLQFPQIGSLLSSFGGSFLTQMKAYKDFQAKINRLATERGQGRGRGPVLSNPTTPGASFFMIDMWIQEQARGAGGFLNPNLGAYH